MVEDGEPGQLLEHALEGSRRRRRACWRVGRRARMAWAALVAALAGAGRGVGADSDQGRRGPHGVSWVFPLFVFLCQMSARDDVTARGRPLDSSTLQMGAIKLMDAYAGKPARWTSSTTNTVRAPSKPQPNPCS